MQVRELINIDDSIEVENSENKNQPPIHRYNRKLIYRYTTRRTMELFGNELPEMGPLIPRTQEIIESRLYQEQKEINITGDKTFYQQPETKSKPKRCVDMEYSPEDFAKGLNPNHLKIKQGIWDSKTGFFNKIESMVNLYHKDIRFLEIDSIKLYPLKKIREEDSSLPTNQSSDMYRIITENSDRLINIHRRHHSLLYGQNHRKIAKWIYWSLMELLYAQTIDGFKDKHPNAPLSFNIHQECHRVAMDLITTKLGEDIAYDVTAGGSFFGNNRTVEAMQQMGIMDDRKYTSNNRFFSGIRFRLFSGEPTISPSNKEAILRSGGDPNVWEGHGEPPVRATLLSPRK